MKRNSNYQTWMTIVYDQSLSIVDIINPQHCMLLQLSDEEIIGKSNEDMKKLYFGPNKESADIIHRSVEKVRDEKRNVYFEYTTTHKDNTVTYAVCYAENGPDGYIYVNVIKIDVDNIFEAREGFMNYVFDISMNNISVGVGMRHISDSGNKKYILFNEVAKEFFENKNVTESVHWNQNEEDIADEKVLKLRDSMKIEKVIRDEKNKIKRWLILTKKKITSKAGGYYIITTMIDITKRRQNEILLEQQFALLNSMYKYLPVGIVIYDRNGNLISLNEKDMEIFGIEKKEDIIGVNIFDEPNTYDWVKEKLRKGEDAEFTLIYDFNKILRKYNPKGFTKTIILHVKNAIIRNKDGGIDGYLQIYEDITDKKKKEELLEQTTIELKSIFDSMSSGVQFYDTYGYLKNCNNIALEILGFSSKKDIIIRGITLFDNPIIPLNLKYDLKNGNKIRFKYNFDSKNYLEHNKFINRSGKLCFDIKVAPMLSKEKKNSGYILEINDITKREELYEELRKSKEEVISSNQLLNRIIDYIPEAMYIKDANDDFRYVRVNDAFCDIIGKSKAEIISKTSYDFFNEEIGDRYYKADSELKKKRNTISYDYSQILKGKQEYIHITKSIFDTSDGKSLIIGILTNLTEIHDMNKELKIAKTNAEKSDKLKSAFLANMSHEIRTPLNAIIGFSELISETESEEEKKQYLNIVKTNNEQLLRLINDILDLSKLESGSMELREETFDINDIYNETYTLFNKKLSGSDISLKVNKPYNRCIISLDKNRITQVLINFMTNANKYTTHGSIEIGYEYENNGIKIYVKDTGIGISKEKHNRVFQRFEKLDNFAQGTGLGLSICKAITQVSHGDIGFESELGVGSTFWAWFPTKVHYE